MALVIEDGTGKADAQSYADADTLTAYATARGQTLTAADDAAKEALLIQAMDYIEAQDYKGYKYTDEQALQWPRGDVNLYGYDVSHDHIPQLLTDALCEVAIGVDGGTNPLANEGRQTESETVGPISVTYASGSRNYTYLKAAETKLQRLLKKGSGGISAVVIRG